MPERTSGAAGRGPLFRDRMCGWRRFDGEWSIDGGDAGVTRPGGNGSTLLARAGSTPRLTRLYTLSDRLRQEFRLRRPPHMHAIKQLRCVTVSVTHALIN